MYTRMLIPLDGSKTAETALPYARLLARALKLPIDLLGVVDAVGLAAAMNVGDEKFLNSLIQTELRTTKDYLEGISRRFPAAVVSCVVEKGKPEDVILHKAASDEGTLITMATHGRAGMSRWLLGSVAEKVLRQTNRPLLLIRGNEEPGREQDVSFNSVTVPLDGSKLAEAAVPGALEFARMFDLPLVLLRAYEIPVHTYMSADDLHATNFEKLRAKLRDEARDYLQMKAQELTRHGARSVSFIAAEGPAAEEIVTIGQAKPANIIAMCSHGRSGVKRWLLGSVTEKVVRHSNGPVLVIPANGATHAESPAGKEIDRALRYTID